MASTSNPARSENLPEEKNEAAMSPDEERKRSREIESMLAKERQKYDDLVGEPRVLLLGSSDSGKTTFLKQLRILHGGGFTDEERKKATATIATNVLDSIQLLINAKYDRISEFPDDIQTSIKEILDVFERIASRPSFNVDSVLILPQLAPYIQAVWKDERIQSVYKRSGQLKIPIQDTAYYFLDKCDALSSPDYIPSNEDLLHMRSATTQITETVFSINESSLHVFDVGGQQKYRKQWAPYFDNVHIIIFLVSLASYDQFLVEDPTINRMHDALQLFGEICNHQLLKHIPITLFLNKKDLFEQKMEYSDLQKHFPDFTSKSTTKKAIRYFEKKFQAQNENESKTVFVHATCCTDTKAMNVIIMTVLENIVKARMKHSKLI